MNTDFFFAGFCVSVFFSIIVGAVIIVITLDKKEMEANGPYQSEENNDTEDESE